MQKKKLSNSYNLFFVVSISLSWWLIVLGISIATTSSVSDSGVEFDIPVVKHGLNSFNKVELEGMLTAKPQYTKTPLVVVHNEFFLISNIEKFTSGVEKNSIKINYDPNRAKLSLDKLANLVSDAVAIQNSEMLIILPAEKAKMSNVVSASRAIQQKMKALPIVLSTEVL